MDLNFIKSLETSDFYTTKNVSKSLFEEYEKIIIKSIVTSFGLDFLFVKDQEGGDVDTIHNVRQIDANLSEINMGSFFKHEKMGYKEKNHETAYADRGKYDSNEYHSDPNFLKRRKEEKSKTEKQGFAVDEYTGRKIPEGGTLRSCNFSKKNS